jgi:hypothetical protein
VTAPLRLRSESTNKIETPTDSFATVTFAIRDRLGGTGLPVPVPARGSSKLNLNGACQRGIGPGHLVNPGKRQALRRVSAGNDRGAGPQCPTRDPDYDAQARCHSCGRVR